MNKLQLSIIIPVYNVEKYLSRCVNSLLIQKSTFAYEIILIDDGSNDGSEITCDRYGSENGIVRVIHKLNGGVSSARNTGLSVAKGEFVWFVDSDDYAEKDSLRTIEETITSHNSDIYEFSFIRNNSKVSLGKDHIFLNNNKDIIRTFLKRPKFHLWNKIIRRKIIGDTTFVNEIKIGEDFLFLATVFNKANSYFYIDSAVYDYFDNRSDSAMTTLTETVKNQNIELIFNYIKKHKNLFNEKNYSALPAVFISKHLFFSPKNTMSVILMSFIKDLQVKSILKANCTLKQKIYLTIFKILNTFK